MSGAWTAVGVAFLLVGAVALMYGFGLVMGAASDKLDRLVREALPSFDDPSDFDQAPAVPDDEAWERIAGPSELFGLAASVGVVYDPRVAQELVVAEAEAILAGERP